MPQQKGHKNDVLLERYSNKFRYLVNFLNGALVKTIPEKEQKKALELALDYYVCLDIYTKNKARVDLLEDMKELNKEVDRFLSFYVTYGFNGVFKDYLGGK